MKIDHNGFLPGCVGIFLGGCVERGEGSSFRAQAHAHNQKGKQYFGWICVRGKRRMPSYVVEYYKDEPGLGLVRFDATLTGEPNRLLMHEYCHILTPGHRHDDTWRKKMRELKQPILKRYQKKKHPEVSRWASISERAMNPDYAIIQSNREGKAITISLGDE